MCGTVQSGKGKRSHFTSMVMDWVTGTWWSCNDTVVKPLPHGPAHTDTNDDAFGSSNAVSLFYVEKIFLADHALQEINAGPKMERCAFYKKVDR